MNHVGIQEWDNANGIHIFRLHYTADDEKRQGEAVFVEQENIWLSPWAKSQYDGFTNKRSFFQEIDIDFSAKSGALIYQLQDEATIEPLSALPLQGTDYYFLDPHPRVPHAHLWVRVDKWGEAWAFRELWPSKVYGQPGNTPEDDNRYRIRDYIETVRWMESEGHPLNHGKALNITKRVIDYAARGFLPTTDDQDQRSVQQRYEEESQAVGYSMVFADAIKDVDAGIEAVNEWLKPRMAECSDGTFKPKSRLHIIGTECPELVWELHNNRFQNLTPLMADRSDPSPKPIAKRNHMTDLLKYACLCGLDYVQERKASHQPWKPLHPGISY